MACTREERFVLRIFLPSGEYKSIFAATFQTVDELCVLCAAKFMFGPHTQALLFEYEERADGSVAYHVLEGARTLKSVLADWPQDPEKRGAVHRLVFADPHEALSTTDFRAPTSVKARRDVDSNPYTPRAPAPAAPTNTVLSVLANAQSTVLESQRPFRPVQRLSVSLTRQQVQQAGVKGPSPLSSATTGTKEQQPPAAPAEFTLAPFTPPAAGTATLNFVLPTQPLAQQAVPQAPPAQQPLMFTPLDVPAPFMKPIAPLSETTSVSLSSQPAVPQPVVPQKVETPKVEIPKVEATETAAAAPEVVQATPKPSWPRIEQPSTQPEVPATTTTTTATETTTETPKIEPPKTLPEVAMTEPIESSVPMARATKSPTYEVNYDLNAVKTPTVPTTYSFDLEMLSRKGAKGVLVVDTGSHSVKAGVAGEDDPRCVVPTVVARTATGDRTYVGTEAVAQEGLRRVCPLNPEADPDWDLLQGVWEHVFERELRVDVREHPLLLTELPTMSESAKMRMVEVMFEAFHCPALYVANAGVLSLYSQGVTTGLAVDCGNRLQIVPIVDGVAIEHAIHKTRRGFYGLTEHLARLLTRRGYYARTSRDLDAVRQLKEALCYVAADYDAELRRPDADVAATWRSADGTATYTIGHERCMCPEALFRPEMLGLDNAGVAGMAYHAVQACPIDLRRTLLSNIVLSGGSTLFPGFKERLQHDILALAAEHHQNLGPSSVHIAAPENRQYLAWIGGSVLGSLPNFLDQCLTDKQYFEL